MSLLNDQRIICLAAIVICYFILLMKTADTEALIMIFHEEKF